MVDAKRILDVSFLEWKSLEWRVMLKKRVQARMFSGVQGGGTPGGRCCQAASPPPPCIVPPTYQLCRLHTPLLYILYSVYCISMRHNLRRYGGIQQILKAVDKHVFFYDNFFCDTNRLFHEKCQYATKQRMYVWGLC